MDNLVKLQQWYCSQCNCDWEHNYGVAIDTLDNPGWYLKVDLDGTNLEGKSFDRLEMNYDSDNDWLICQIKDRKFDACCGPEKLDTVISIFLQWANDNE